MADPSAREGGTNEAAQAGFETRRVFDLQQERAGVSGDGGAVGVFGVGVGEDDGGAGLHAHVGGAR